MTRKITVIDFGRGNLHSIVKALRHVGASVEMDENGGRLMHAERLILPGVGAFHEGVAGLKARNQWDRLVAYCQAGRPLMGICLGAQLLLDYSLEFGQCAGLGIIPGKVVEIPKGGERVPHVGWKPIKVKNLDVLQRSGFQSIGDDAWFYFVHSFQIVPDSKEHVLVSVRHGATEIVATVGKENIVGFQFHPEKSGDKGLAILEDFLK